MKPTDVELEGTNAGVNMAEPLPWPEIESICKQYGADAVLTIENYDTDAFVRTSSYLEKYKDKEGVERTRTKWRADANLGVTIGWRLYDPKTKIIEDEFSVDLLRLLYFLRGPGKSGQRTPGRPGLPALSN